MEKLTLSVVEVARLLGISRGSAYAAILTGELPHLRVGKRILVPKAALARMLEQAGQKGARDGY